MRIYTRIRTIQGARLIVIPTADFTYPLPPGPRAIEPYPNVATMCLPASSFSNSIFMAYNNRCGSEQNTSARWTYRGNSLITGPHGNIILAANAQEETLLVTDCIPYHYGPVHIEGDYLVDRRPELYSELI